MYIVLYTVHTYKYMYVYSTITFSLGYIYYPMIHTTDGYDRSLKLEGSGFQTLVTCSKYHRPIAEGRKC